MATFIDSIKDADTGEQYSIIPDIDLSVDDNFVLTVSLKNPDDETVVLKTANINLPIEGMVVNATYNNTTKKVSLELQNGNTLEVDISDMIELREYSIVQTIDERNALALEADAYVGMKVYVKNEGREYVLKDNSDPENLVWGSIATVEDIDGIFDDLNDLLEEL